MPAFLILAVFLIFSPQMLFWVNIVYPAHSAVDSNYYTLSQNNTPGQATGPDLDKPAVSPKSSRKAVSMSKERKIIRSTKLPPAVGPYSPGVQAGHFLFLSGQLALNPAGELLQGDIVVQTIQIMENIKTLLEEAGLTLQDIVKTTVFLTDMGDFAEMNRVYAEYFPENPPARSTIQVAALPKGAAIEIEAIAVKK
ncbi:endoribonuclease L-PSP [Desulfobacca acetoxidans DSM 11109]|uniref:Endoribonuclease L-PSP n=2 Tax=Desulfobacca acetoxidans TaxID=60893 RepID=F2NGW4_DESAR|nr:endoribonuclease L-PSP [Desulfobacca acetoxidans DSM 11109]